MFERCTKKARGALFYQRFEASKFGPSVTETGRLGLGREESCFAARVLLECGADISPIPLALETTLEPYRELEEP